MDDALELLSPNDSNMNDASKIVLNDITDDKYGLLLTAGIKANSSSNSNIIRSSSSSNKPANIVTYSLNHNEFIACNDNIIYRFNLTESMYCIISKTIATIAAVEYVHSKYGQIVIAYHNGIVEVRDILTKMHIYTLQNEKSTSDVISCGVRLLRCHPTKSMLVMASTSGAISLWDLRSYQCTRTLSVSEGIIDIKFELDGLLMVIVLEKSGIYLYRSSDCQLACHCPLPETERKPTWVSYCSTVSPPDKNIANMRLILAGDNGMLYCWHCSSINKNKTNNVDVHTARLEGIVELPSNIKVASSMLPLGDAAYGPRIAILTNNGSVHVFDVEGDASTIGAWTVTAEFPPIITQGATSSAPSLLPFVINAAMSSSTSRVFDSIFVCKNDVFILVGADGMIRMFDSEASLGNSPRCGSFLRTRAPRSVHRKVTNDIKSSHAMSSTASSSGKKAPSPEHSGSDKYDRKSTVTIDSGTVNNATHTNRSSIKSNTNRSGDSADRQKNATDRRTKSFEHKVRGKSKSGKYNELPANFDELSLHEIAQYSQEERQINSDKLKAYLLIHGEYQERFRPLIWRYLLKLPENSEAYQDLVNRGTHKSQCQLYDRYPVRAKRIFTRLQNICSQLAHWSPIYGELGYLPTFVFPFVLVYGNDELAALETVITMLMWWGYSWNATFPNPPVHICDTIASLLKLHDVRLYNHLYQAEASPGLIGWIMISTIFSELLTKGDWSRLMDHLFTHFDTPSLFLLTPVAIMINLKELLLKAVNADVMYRICRQQHTSTLSISSIIRTLFQLNSIPAHRNGNDSELSDIQRIRNTINSAVGSPIWPLPKKRYPAYNGYPKVVVDWQLREREYAMSLHNEVARRDDVLLSLESKLNDLKNNNMIWLSHHDKATDVEVKHRHAVMKREREHLLELQHVEDLICKERMKALEAQEVAAREELQLQAQIENESRGLIDARTDSMRERMQSQLELQRVRELTMRAETEANERVRQLHLQRSKEEWMKTMTSSITITQQESNHQNSLSQQQYKQQEDEAKIISSINDLKKKLHNENSMQDFIHNEVYDRIASTIIDTEAKRMDMDRSRGVRLAMDQSAEARKSALRSMKILASVEQAVDDNQKATLYDKISSRSSDTVFNTISAIHAESKRLIDQEVINNSKLQSMQSKHKQEMMCDFIHASHDVQLKSILMAENELRNQLDSLTQISKQLCASNTATTAAASSVGIFGHTSDDTTGQYKGSSSGTVDEDSL